MEQTPKIITLVKGNQIISFADGLHATEVHEVIKNKLTGEIVYDETFQAPTTNVVDGSDFPLGEYDVIYQYDDVVQKDTVEITMGNLNQIKLITDPPIGGIVALIAGYSDEKHISVFSNFGASELTQQIKNEGTNVVVYSKLLKPIPLENEVDISGYSPGTYKVEYFCAENLIIQGATRFDVS